LNDAFVMLGIESWKPVLSALLLPPVPLLLLVLVGARMILWRRGLAWLVVLLAVAGLWLTACSGAGEWLQRSLLSPPLPLAGERLAEFKRSLAGGKVNAAIVVLGGGRETTAPEYGVANLSPLSLERLRYGLWLHRETGAPVMFAGGIGHQAQPGVSEAEVAADIATREYNRSLKWTESRSRDTRENAQYATTLLHGQGIQRVVLVTHGWHMARAQRAFVEAAKRQSETWEVVAAPMGLAQKVESPVLRWIPTSEGFMLVRNVVREKLGWWLGA